MSLHQSKESEFGHQLGLDEVILRVMVLMHQARHDPELDRIEALLLQLQAKLHFVPDVRLLTRLSANPLVRRRHLIIDITTLRSHGDVYWRNGSLVLTQDGLARGRHLCEPRALIDEIDRIVNQDLQQRGEESP